MNVFKGQTSDSLITIKCYMLIAVYNYSIFLPGQELNRSDWPLFASIVFLALIFKPLELKQ